MDTIKITLETLYDILCNEKKREDLQKLESTFFIDVVGYLREKQALLENKKTDENIFVAGEKDKLEYELRSIRRILKEIYEKREKKIIDIVLNKSRTKSDIIDTSAMLIEEKEFYQELLTVLDAYRRGVLLTLFKGELPLLMNIIKKNSVSDQNALLMEGGSKAAVEVLSPLKSVQASSGTRIRFIHPTPSFVWKDMKVYGPYNIGEEIDIFPEVAELLVKKKRAEKV